MKNMKIDVLFIILLAILTVLSYSLGVQDGRELSEDDRTQIHDDAFSNGYRHALMDYGIEVD